MKSVRELIRDVPDFPKAGILFKDITPVLASPEAFDEVIAAMGRVARPLAPARIVGIESRGFILGAPLAHSLKLPFVPVRKPGKLPYEIRRVEYELEYGTDAVEIHVDAIEPGERVLIVDDLLATGGTAEATCRLVEGLGATIVGIVFLIELGFLGGAERLAPRPITSLLEY